MSNYNITAGTSDFNYQKHDLNYMVLSRKVDFSLFSGTGPGVAADTADILNLPAGFVVETVGYKILTASSTGSSVFGAGLSGNSVYFLPNTTSATQTAGTYSVTGAGASGQFNDITSVTTFANSNLKMISPADTLRVVLGATAPLNGQVQFFVKGWNVNAV